MKTFLKLVLIFSLLYCGSALAQTTDLAGTWQGKLAISKDQTVTVHFIITKQPDGSFKAVLNSPDFGGIKNVQASKMEFKDNKLFIDVTALSGSYSGALAKGVFTGEWSQPGSKIPLVLSRYQAPTANSLKPLLGSWVGKLKANETTTLTIVLRFEMNKEGKFVGLLDVPDQGAKDLAVTDIALNGSDVTFKIPVGKANYVGKLSGATITGGIKQGGQDTKIDFARGKYTPPPPDIKISAEDMKQLLGRWSGKLKINDTISLTFVIRFEQPEPGKNAIFLDSPDQKAKDIPVTSASMTDGKLIIKVAAVMGEYSATLSGNKLDGTWKQPQMPQPIPLTLTKE
jgi:hypothetical protein